nr:PREDICTED: anaphase-promoting complex subunit 7 isoform X1 [Musa acuminata subsp. malaccensis]
MEVPKDHITTLLDNGLFYSAQMLGCFLVSSVVTNSEASPYLKAENLVLQGDALFGEKEFRRALSMYKQALQHCKIISKQTMNNSRSSFSASSRSSSPNSMNVSPVNENEVKFKITLCHCALSENRPALVEMEGIPPKARTLRMNLTLGKLYRISRHNRSAIACYKDCLRNCPYVLEAITALAELGVSSKEVSSLFPQVYNTPSRGGRPPFDHLDPARWLHRYVEAQCCIASSDYKGGLDHLSELLQQFPNNVHILLEIAKVEAIIGRHDEAIMNFEKVRSIDPFIVTYMDEYAMLLKLKSDISKLNKLVHDLLNIDPTRAEVFVALSALWERKDERRALSYAEKSLRIDDRHISGHIMKGNLYLSLNRPDAAVTAFRGAQELRPDLRSYQGLVRSYLALSKTKEALFIAREAMKLMPQSAKALKLVGDVHASSSSGREKARKFYESALRLEPGFLGAALALAELHVVEGRHKDAVSLLERYVKDWADDSLHIKLAQVFAATNMLSEALSHYQAALRINPQNEAAKKGLERLEKQMKVWLMKICCSLIFTAWVQKSLFISLLCLQGMDPDAPDEEEENEADDAEGDQEEGELL